MGQGKTSLVSAVIASFCIIVYIAAVVFGAVQVIISTNDRRALAEEEFGDLADRASSAAIFGFMSQAYQEALMDVLEDSETLLGAIISGSDGQYGFERRAGTVINWVGDSPRFKPGFGVSGEPYHRVIRISGQRNGTIQAQYSLIDYEILLRALRQTLTAVLAALAAAVLTLLAEMLMKNRVPPYATISSRGALPVYGEDKPEKPAAAEPAEKPPLPPSSSGADKPEGLYSPRSNVGWEAYTADRLASELHRCASTEQDLVFINIDRTEDIDFGGGPPYNLPEQNQAKARPSNNHSSNVHSMSNSLYLELADEIVKFFIARDLIFEKGEHGFAVIIPGIALEQGIAKSEEFCRRMEKRFPGIFRAGLRIGLSSRSGRLVEAERLMFESAEALLKAMEDPVSPIIAFKSDPDKYREFIARR